MEGKVVQSTARRQSVVSGLHVATVLRHPLFGFKIGVVHLVSIWISCWLLKTNLPTVPSKNDRLMLIAINCGNQGAKGCDKCT